MQHILNKLDSENQNETQINIFADESKDKKEQISQESQTENKQKENIENKIEDVDEIEKYFDENETLLKKKNKIGK